MTDEPKKYVLGKGRLYFDPLPPPEQDEVDLTQKREPTFQTVAQFVEKYADPTKFHEGGYIHFPKPYQEEIMARLTDGVEYIVPKDDPRGRFHRVGETTGRFSGRHFTMHIALKDEMTPEVKKLRDQLRFYQFRAYYGERIAFLLTSKDPRQRKRGTRLRDKLFAWGRNLSELEARAMVHKFRESMEGAKLAAFWNTELGEPYTPGRYRKD